MSVLPRKPSLDSVATINADGSRFFLHPADVLGRFTWARRLSGVLLVAIYVSLPWIPIGGHPAVFMDVANRRFHLLGVTFLAQDGWLLFFLISGVGFTLFFVTALLGRLWCGWACPYTVFLEHIFRRIERYIEGDATKRRGLDGALWSPAKFAKRTLKHGVFLLCAAIVAHIFLSYFVSMERLHGYMREGPSQHLSMFVPVIALTGILYFCFAWFREQFCVVLCPYGRLQSALTDDDTLVIGYDAKRGEPRGKASDPHAGQCVDCRRCVQVCPTGIDIRNGLQMECIGCAACIDACDEVMRRLHRPKGLVRYDSLNGLEGERRRILRPRMLIYTALMLLGAGAFCFAASQVHSFEMSVVRMRGLPYVVEGATVRNQYLLRVVSKSDSQEIYHIAFEGLPEGAGITGLEHDVTIPPQGEAQQTVVARMDASHYRGPFHLTAVVTPKTKGKPLRRQVEFLGPDPRAFQELQPKNP